MIISTGVDIEEIRRIQQISPAIRGRFLQRILTPTELSTDPLPDETITGLFCAKEAVAKALGCGIGIISWQEIEICSGDLGKPELSLSGNASRLAKEKGITSWSISISHSREYAVAFVVGYSGTV